MTLIETHRRMAAALMLPLTSNNHIANQTAGGAAMAEEAAGFIRPNSRLTSLERLEIYARSYWFRLLDSFRDDFPGLAVVLGPAAFERLARAYLSECPSRTYTLRDLGSHLEKWLREHPKYAGENRQLAIDMVGLEWAHIVAFDGPEDKVLRPEDLAQLSPQLRVGLQPYISLLDLHHPVDEIRVRCNSDREGSAAASNAVLRRGIRSRERVPQPQAEPTFLAVHRLDFSVYYRRLSAEEFRLLNALRASRSIAGAIRSSFQSSSVASDDVPELLNVWFSAWAQFGWLTAHHKVGRG
jgi:hypothetical protein